MAEFEAKLESMLQTRVVNIPDHVLQPLFSFMHYCILGSFHLNMLADPKLVEPEDVRGNSLKRKRIILRMAKGYTGTKKRRFVYSKLKESLRGIEDKTLKQQLNILESQEIIEKPSNKSFSLMRNMSSDATEFLQSDCLFNGEGIMTLTDAIAQLKD